MASVDTKGKRIRTNNEDEEELKSVLGLQHQLLMEAKTLGSDLDLAFQFQMQEAVNASLSLHRDHPSASQDVAVETPADDLEFDCINFMLEDISRYEMERKDREESEEEMRKFRDGLNRSIHDQNFARYIMNVPEDEWNRYGDDYQRPYNGNVEAESEGFRVYVKGLISEEMVRGMKVMVGGVGAAICDFGDNLILEVTKKLEGAESMSGEMAGVEAVIHGLNAALSLDLKRVTVLVDDFLVHQYITGKQQPGQSKMGTKLSEVALLQKQFAYFRPSLVASNDMKFVFKLARDAIVSQITWPAETSNGKVLMETCLICFEDKDTTQMFSVDGCFHRYCFSCMKLHVEAKLLIAMVASCPCVGCNSEVTIDSCGKFLDTKSVEIMINRKKEASIAVSEKVYCAFPKCSALMSKSEVLQYTKPVFIAAEQTGARKCVKCQRFFCINCKVPWHYNMTCFDYKRSNHHPAREDAMLNSLANTKQWRMCIKCKNMVELASGCYHITCRCGYEFCYTCGAQWLNKKATCSCPIWDERNIIDNPRRRR